MKSRTAIAAGACVGALTLILSATFARTSPAPAAPDVNRLLSTRIKHVFVIYQENRSFDSEFGTFPGANGVWSAAARKGGFAQWDPALKRWIHPFRLTEPDVYYESNARGTQLAAFAGGKMNGFVAAQEQSVMHYEPHATAAQLGSVGAEAMYHLDCATIPYLWAYAKRFTLFDNFFQALRAPSTPSNIEIIAAQNGLTQYEDDPKARARGEEDPGDPIFADLDPAFGPYNPAQPSLPHQLDQTYANVLLTMQRSQVGRVKSDTLDVRQDKAVIARLRGAAIPWRWYEEGYANPTHTGLIAHHLAPQYFGYVAHNAAMVDNMRGLRGLYADLQKGTLPARGVFYVKGGSHNVLGLHPANRDPYVQKHYLGDDDHPGYTDSQIAQAHVASIVSAIARSKYWNDSAIVITWDDLGGFWDHVTPHPFETCPDRHPCGDGARVPAIVISRYAKSGAIVHEFDDQNSVLKFIETVFGLPALASLPDEKRFLPLGPRDGNALLGNLAGAFDVARLEGRAAPLPASSAIFADQTIRTIPSPVTCKQIGVTPATPPPGVSDAPPPGFSPRPFEPKAH